MNRECHEHTKGANQYSYKALGYQIIKKEKEKESNSYHLQTLLNLFIFLFITHGEERI